MADLTPVNYSIDVASPFQSAMQGYAAGAAIRDDQQKQVLMQQQVAAQQAQQQMLYDLARKPNPTADDYSRVMTAIPSLAEHLQKAWTTKNDAQQQAHASDLLQWGAAIKSGQPQITADAMSARADALEAASGRPTPESQALRVQAQVVTDHPEFALGQIQAILAANPKGAGAAETLNRFGTEARAAAQAPADLSIKQSDARIKAVEAGNAPTKTDLSNVTAAEGILSAQAQRRVADFNSQIAAANSETERGRLTLARDEFVEKQRQEGQQKGQSAQVAMDSLATALQTVTQALQHPGLSGWTGAGTVFGKVADNIPGTDAHDFRSIIQTVKSQQFLTQIQALKQTGKNGSTGLGALSNAEGSKVEAAIANLDPDQGEPQLRQALTTVQQTLLKAQAKLAADPHLPTTGGAFVMKHPVYGNVTDGDVNRLMTKFPGATRQQVLDYLKSTGGQ